MADTAHGGFYVGEGAYETFAKNVDPLGDEVAGAAQSHVGPHADVDGDGFSEVGQETGLTAAYNARMSEFQQSLHSVGGSWHDMATASRNTGGNFDALETDNHAVLHSFGKDL